MCRYKPSQPFDTFCHLSPPFATHFRHALAAHRHALSAQNESVGMVQSKNDHFWLIRDVVFCTMGVETAGSVIV